MSHSDLHHLLFLPRVVEEMVKVPAVFRRYVPYLLGLLIDCMARVMPKAHRREAVLPVAFALFTTVSDLELQLLHATVGSSPAARMLLKDLHNLYVKEHRFSGKV